MGMDFHWWGRGVSFFLKKFHLFTNVTLTQEVFILAIHLVGAGGRVNNQ